MASSLKSTWRLTFLVGLVMQLIGCATHVIDFGRIREPILLSSDPVLGGSNVEERRNIGIYHGSAKTMIMAASGGGGAGSSDHNETDLSNTFQLAAFREVVGYRDRAITDLKIHTKGWGLNMVFALMSEFETNITGQVVRIKR